MLAKETYIRDDCNMQINNCEFAVISLLSQWIPRQMQLTHNQTQGLMTDTHGGSDTVCLTVIAITLSTVYTTGNMHLENHCVFILCSVTNYIVYEVYEQLIQSCYNCGSRMGK